MSVRTFSIALATAIILRSLYGFLIPNREASTLVSSNVYALTQELGDRRFVVSTMDISWGKSFLMAFPDPNLSHAQYPGGPWYKVAWENHTIADVETHYQDWLKGKCTSSSEMVFQFGSHLGVYPLLAAAQGCTGMTVDGYPPHLLHIALSANLNAFANRFHTLHAAIGKENGVARFAKNGVALGAEVFDEVPMTTIDDVFWKAKSEIGFKKSPLVIIDVEYSDQDALLGGQRTIASRLIDTFYVEIWLHVEGKSRSEQDLLPMNLFKSAGYTGDINQLPINSAADLIKNRDFLCKHQLATTKNCLVDVHFKLQ
jgi:hypothetical protein